MRLPVVVALLAVIACLAAPGCSEEQVQGTLVGGANGGSSGDMFGGVGDGKGDPDTATAGTDTATRTAPDLAGWLESDVPPPPGSFLAPCVNHSDCDSGVCVEGRNGPYCSKTCSGTCANNWFTCKEWSAPSGDVSFICLPRFKTLCFPCMEHKDCNAEGESGNLCLPYQQEGRFCGVKCDPLNPLCPPGYGCTSVIDDATGLKSNQCMRQGAGGQGLAICDCALKAIEQGLKTQCSVTGVVYDSKATCFGTRYCKADGLTACSAHVPDIELCDGKDNDCNGKTDDFQEKNVPCTSKPNEFGKCEGVLIDCVDGQATCSAKPAQPEKCNGLDDNCDGKTDEGLCEDGDPCTKDVCNTDGSCKHAAMPAGAQCDDGSVCTTVDKCIAGKCIGGKEQDCDDQDPCTTDSCNPIDGCQNKPASDAVCKDDGNPCTLDQCQQGKCVHPPASGKPCTDDGEACTQDVCNQGSCDHPPAKDGTPCLDDGKPCTLDVCQAGKCAHPNGDGIPCLDDGKPCTADICQGGGCAHPPNTDPCEDGNYCTEGDKCSGGGCKPGAPKNCNDNNPCTNDACNTKTGCVHTDNNFASCVAPNGECPTGQCSGGACLSKPNVTCQTKVKVDLCGSVEVAGLCTAGGKCVPSKKYDPSSCTMPCKSFCAKCFGISVCLDFLFGP